MTVDKQLVIFEDIGITKSHYICNWNWTCNKNWGNKNRSVSFSSNAIKIATGDMHAMKIATISWRIANCKAALL